jgi:hypothetical protein
VHVKQAAHERSPDECKNEELWEPRLEQYEKPTGSNASRTNVEGCTLMKLSDKQIGKINARRTVQLLAITNQIQAIRRGSL